MIIAVIVILAVAGIGFFLVRSNSSTNETAVTTTPTEADDELTQTGSTSESAEEEDKVESEDSEEAVKTVNVEAGSFYYKPAEIRVKKGQKVKIVMKAVSLQHDFNIDELGVKMPITKNGETGTVEFTPEKAGTFEYYCSVGQHRAQGQVGKLIVE